MTVDRRWIGLFTVATMMACLFGPSEPSYNGARWTRLAVGLYHTCGMIEGSTRIYCWGDNRSGQLGDGTTPDRVTPTAVVGGLVFASVTAGGQHSCGRVTSGAAYCWGNNGNGQLGNGTTATSPSPIAVSGGVVFASIAAATRHTCGVTSSGAGYCWGRNQVGQLGDGTQTERIVPVAVAGGFTFVEIAPGGDPVYGSEFTCGLTTAGDAYCWGDNHVAQLGDGTLTLRPNPAIVSGGHNFVAVTAGSLHACGLEANGTAWCWGSGNNGHVGNNALPGFSTVPVPVSAAVPFTSISARSEHTCALSTSGLEYCWGDGIPTPALVPGGGQLSSLRTGPDHHCGLTAAGVAWCRGVNKHGQVGDGTTITRGSMVVVSSGLTFASISVGGDPSSSLDLQEHTCGVTPTGAAYCWGANASGQIGDGTLPSLKRASPSPVTGSVAFSTVTTGAGHGCGLSTGGATYCWGNATILPVQPVGVAPVLMNEGVSFTTIDAAGGTTCGLVTSGGVRCWGASGTPIAFDDGALRFDSLVVGLEHRCGLTAAGTAYCWGTNSDGRLGVGDVQPRTTPDVVFGGLAFASLTVGTTHTCGVTRVGLGYCWGDNGNGQVGDGTVFKRTAPMPVSGGGRWKRLGAGRNLTCGVTTDDIGYCWGSYPSGQLGEPAWKPVRVSGNILFAVVEAGDLHSCGITPRGAMYCWGQNTYGQLGDGTNAASPEPVQVLSP